MENQILLEKIGESKTENLLNDCNKIYMENFRKEYPNYFESNHIKSISKVLVTNPNSNEILGIGMSCMNDLLVNNFAKWLGGWMGASTSTSGDRTQSTNGVLNTTFGRSHGGSNFSHWGNNNSGGSRGLEIKVANGINVPQKTDFATPISQGNTLNLIVNAGTFSSGLGTVDWTAGGTVTADFTISNSYVLARWSASGQGAMGAILLLSDLISPVVPITIGQSIFLDITMVFT